MNTKKIMCCMAVLFLLTTICAAADTRNIYVGDIITLQIEKRGFSAGELTQKFKDFEIIEVKEKSGNYLVSLRTFEPGERIIQLGGGEIVINVASTLDDIQRDDIFEGDLEGEESEFSFPWHILFYVFSGVFVLSGGFVLMEFLMKGRIKKQSPFLLFLVRTSALNFESGGYLVDITRCFKEYLEGVYSCQITGKTTKEITDGIKNIQALENTLPEIWDWLTECDKLKFSGAKVSTEQKQRHYMDLVNLVEKIDKQKKEESS